MQSDTLDTKFNEKMNSFMQKLENNQNNNTVIPNPKNMTPVDNNKIDKSKKNETEGGEQDLLETKLNSTEEVLV